MYFVIKFFIHYACIQEQHFKNTWETTIPKWNFMLKNDIRTGSKMLDVMLTFCIPCKFESLVSEGLL